MLALALVAALGATQAYAQVTSISPASFPTCLQADGPLENGTPVRIVHCNDATTQWNFNDGSTTVRVEGSNFCLDSGTEPQNGWQAKIWECIEGIPAQSWEYNAPVIKLAGSNQCLDLTNGNVNDGTHAQIWECTWGPNQQWTRDPRSSDRN